MTEQREEPEEYFRDNEQLLWDEPPTEDDPRRDLTPFNGKHHEWQSSTAFLHAQEITTGLHTIRERHPIDVYYEPAGSDTTIVIFHAALSRPDVTLPMITGSKVTQDGNPNRIYVSDPSLYAESALTLGWYAGATGLPLQELLPPIIEKMVAAARGSRLVFFGASGGGFAALYYSRLFPGSLAIVVNPQTILANFPAFTLRKYTLSAWGAITAAQHERVLAETIHSNLCDLYAESFPNHVLYVQNEQDTDHMGQHLEPFRSAVGHNPRFRLIRGAWGEGHVPPPNEEIRSIVRSATEADNWAGAPTI